ncbi:MAG: helix-turn-helix domain-containing protein [Acidimicrobiia bacterium]
MEFLSVPQAAERLGVSERRVRQLIELRRLPAQKVGKRWIVDAKDIHEMRESDRQAGRPYSSRNAWALLVLAAGREPGWLSSPERTRLQGILESHGIAKLLPRLSRRSEVLKWYVHPSLLERLSADPRTVIGGAGAADTLIDESRVEVYIPSACRQQIESEYFVELEADRPNVIARSIDGPWPFDSGQQVADAVVAAADLREHASDPRLVRIAEELLADA